MAFHPLVWLFAIGVVAEGVLMAFAAANGALHEPGKALAFVSYSVGAGVGYLLAVSTFTHVAARYRAAIFWGLAIGLRLLLLPAVPSDDFWRFLWEGKLVNEGWNPYLLAPADPALGFLHADWWKLVSQPNVAGIFAPGALSIFAKMAAISPTILFFKLTFLAADLITLTLLLRLNTGRQRYRITSWYAWNPLVIYCFAGGAHFDSLMILPLVAAVLALYRANPLNSQQPAWIWAIISSLLLGVAVSIKLMPFLLVPAWIVALRSRAITLLLVPAVLYFFAAGFGFPAVNVFRNAPEYMDVTHSNDAIWWLVESTIWANPSSENLRYAIAALLVSIGLAICFRNNWRAALLWSMGAVLLLSPSIHPWYVTWILPVAAWRGARAWFVFSISIFFYFLLWDQQIAGQPWPEPALWLRLCIFVPPLLAWPLLEMVRRRSSENGSVPA